MKTGMQYMKFNFVTYCNKTDIKIYKQLKNSDIV